MTESGHETRGQLVEVLAIGFLLVSLTAVGSEGGDGVVALQTAAPSCADDSGRVFVDCGNGTVTDNRTGLVWLRWANCLAEPVDWHTAMQIVAGLADQDETSLAGFDDCGLEDHSSPGEWRLPTRAEWAAMIAGAAGCSPSVPNDLGDDCWEQGVDSSFLFVQPSPYWASTTHTPIPTGAAGVHLGIGAVINNADKTTESFRVWAVRGGQ